MRALVVSTLSDDLSGCSLVERARPSRGPGQLLVRVRAAALNFPDLLMTRGAYQLKPALPFTLGMELAGEVVEADEAGAFAVGDRVVCTTRLGAFADHAVCDAAATRRCPAALDFVVAAGVGVAYLTAYVALVKLAGVHRGDWVLIHGATGGVGLAAVDLARAAGARVIATSRSSRKLAVVAEEYAPEHVLPAAGFRAAVREITGGGADIVYDPVGGDVFDESTRCVAFGGRLLVVGFASGRIATVPANIPLIKGFSIVGVRAGEYGRRNPVQGARALDAVWDLAAAGHLRPRIARTYPLADWKEAFAALAASEAVGKLVLIP